ncbi:MAG TPA: glycosyltransferase family 9 protein, partial [Planctomycetota bacterium]|nr:glycosyltransferase family 9 protein [Planctomycetota bacterium]
VALVGAAGERAWTRDVEEWARPVADGRLANLAGLLSIGGLHALLERADVFVGNDSGPMHLAAAVGTPTVGLFGPETPVMYAPLGLRTQALYEPPACSPCINVHDNKVANCVRGRPECLMNLSVDMVLEAARALRARGRFELLPDGRATGVGAP